MSQKSSKGVWRAISAWRGKHVARAYTSLRRMPWHQQAE